MGNSCVGPNLGNNGFLQSVTNAVWKSRTQELPGPEQDKSSSKNDSNDKNEQGNSEESSSAKGSNVQSIPPSQAKMDGEQAKGAEAPKVNVESNSDKPAAAAEGAKQNNKPAAAAHMKRISSVGLQLESVLGRKTGNLKEIYSLGRKLGQGQFGTTFFCLEKSTGKEFACKTIAKRKLTTQEDVEDVRREIQIMHHLAGHPNVISIVGAYEDAVAVHVIMELCTGGELFDRIIQKGHYTEKKAAELARIIVGVVEACHSLGVMHRDLKPENFLFVNEEEESALKTIDFGLSMFFKPGKIPINLMCSVLSFLS